MNRTFLFFILVFGYLTPSGAEIPVHVRSNDTNAMTKGLITALATMIDRHPQYRVTNDTSELHVVINVSAQSNGDAVAFAALLELRPPNGFIGVAARSNMVLTNLAESTTMAFALCEKLLIEDKMINKLLYMRSVQVASGDLNEVCRLMQAAKSATDRGRI